MIISYCFKGDNYKNVKYVQHDVYETALWQIFEQARSLYLQSSKILNIATDVSEAIAHIISFDHRVLQATHDLIAAYFRYVQEDDFYPDLFEQKLTEEKRIEKLWFQWLDNHLNILLEEPAIVRAICTAVAFQNTERSYQAEDLLHVLLKERYYELNDIEYISKSNAPFCKHSALS